MSVRFLLLEVSGYVSYSDTESWLCVCIDGSLNIPLVQSFENRSGQSFVAVLYTYAFDFGINSWCIKN